MRVGIDARELCGKRTGVGRYLMGLLDAWAADSGSAGHEYVLYVPTSLDIPLDGQRFFTRTVPGSPGTWWEQVRLPAAMARDHLDVFFAPAYSAPLISRVPTVVALHDLSFVAHPEWFRSREGIRRRWFARESAARARSVITISEFSRRELLDRLHLPAGKVHVVPPGITAPGHLHSPTPGPLPASASTNGAQREPHVLYVGSVFNRRHVPDLIRAFSPIARVHADARLHLVGDNRTYPHQDLAATIRDETLDGSVNWRSYVPDDELARLYGMARAFAFLSEYEGLGLTPLEALAAGVPAVLLDTPVARESCADAALYVSPNDVRATTTALERLLFEEPTRQALLSAAPAVLARYDWRKAGRDTLSVIEAAA